MSSLESTDLPMEKPSESNALEDSESFVVAIDAGGSGCKSVLMNKSGQFWTGQSGPCNVLTMGVESAMTTISESLQQAVNSHPTLAPRSFRSVSISCAWVGMAGYGRPALKFLIQDGLTKTLGLEEGKELRITTDVDLLAAAVPDCPQVKSAIALVAGTGSIAMSFNRQDNDPFTRVARVGGWGHALGDDGSGYWLGWMGLRAALANLDLARLHEASGNTCVRSKICDDTLVEQILACVALCDTDTDPEALDLVGHAAVCGVRCVAALAKIILDAYTTSAIARDIIEKGARSLADLVKLLVTEQRIESSDTILVLAGGLMNNDIYWQLVNKYLTDESVCFLSVQTVQHPALAAAEWLSHKM